MTTTRCITIHKDAVLKVVQCVTGIFLKVNPCAFSQYLTDIRYLDQFFNWTLYDKGRLTFCYSRVFLSVASLYMSKFSYQQRGTNCRVAKLNSRQLWIVHILYQISQTLFISKVYYARSYVDSFCAFSHFDTQLPCRVTQNKCLSWQQHWHLWLLRWILSANWTENSAIHCASYKESVYMSADTVRSKADRLSWHIWRISCVNATCCLFFESSLHIRDSLDLSHTYMHTVGNEEVTSICRQVLRSHVVANI